MNAPPFTCRSLTLPVSVTTTASSSVALANAGNVLRIVNEGANAAFISVGTGTQTATLPNSTPTVTSTPVLPGTDITLGIDPTQVLNVSAITRTSTTLLHFIVGEGA